MLPVTQAAGVQGLVQVLVLPVGTVWTAGAGNGCTVPLPGFAVLGKNCVSTAGTVVSQPELGLP